ncbi:alpha-L-rhamnosidase-related protein [Mucisphaera calidilacus]|uniref:Bacterial alpha-L-rhamnosidase n=1 Tax=Mucisphaera calidilacus TaxID=2527982 RepID=A0A518C159_9BACT|nr:alpha-L-rhamnosidase C-terminal domain-containing protein [Mucisphaera calidilacus]QDU72961.1 Bacterial alpha-L-rhamnosidase [Mucisphaera calidilacus]
MNPTDRRLPLSPAPRPGDAGSRHRYPIDTAAWVWAPGWQPDQRSFVRFSLDFLTTDDQPLLLEVTADQRYVLTLDGLEAGRGPDRAELNGWSFHRYKIPAHAGQHRLEAWCWWLPAREKPLAQVTHRPGFALVGLDHLRQTLTTGIAPWKAAVQNGWQPHPSPDKFGYHVVGCGFEIQGHARPEPPADAVVVHQARDQLDGVLTSPYRCEPSPLPEQQRSLFQGGTLRAVQHDHDTTIRSESNNPDLAPLTAGQPVEIPANTTLQLLWDLEDYLCAYPRLTLDNGRGSTVEMTWAESLYDHQAGAFEPKGDRAAVAGKQWLGFGDLFRHPGGHKHYDIPWWRSGRWLRLAIQTAEQPLTLRDARPLTTGYPHQPRWAFDCDHTFPAVFPLCEKSLARCVHETFIDCPYYEQLQYTGDTRVQALAWLATTADPRPVRRALELLDRSRWLNGFVAERAPTCEPQTSATYSLVQPAILRDYAMWADDAESVRSLLPGSRAALEHALACIDDTGLPTQLPGWLFVDWVARPDWERGVPGCTSPTPGEEGSEPPLSAPVALHLPIALEAMARVEELLGEDALAERYRHHAHAVMSRIIDTFADPERRMIADDPQHTRWSEHAQALALDCACLPEPWRQHALNALVQPDDDMAPASVYFSHHVHEALLRHNRVDAFLQRLGFWNSLIEQGFLTAIESPEPSRSDCHGWGAHPIYHALSALAGIRPDAAGFATARITPRFGPLTHLQATLPHPRGEITVDLRRNRNTLAGTITTPVPGSLHWNGHTTQLTPGTARL